MISPLSSTAPYGSDVPTDADGLLWAPATLDLSIVVPYYNPGDKVRDTVDRLLATLRRGGVTFEVIAVSDGSTDGSEASLRGLPPQQVRRVRLARNQGKGEALRVGFSMSRGRFVGFIDADGDIPPEQVSRFAAVAAAANEDEAAVPDAVVASKRHPDSAVVFPPLRRLYSWWWQTLVRALFHLKVRDTQTGLKLFRREVLAAALPYTIEKRFALDLELLVVADQLGYRVMDEVPVQIVERQGSTVSLRAVLAMLSDLLGIFHRLQVPPFHGAPAAQRAHRRGKPRAQQPRAPQPRAPRRASRQERAAGRAGPENAGEVVEGPMVEVAPSSWDAAPSYRDAAEVAAAIARSEARFAEAQPLDRELVLVGKDHSW